MTEARQHLLSLQLQLQTRLEKVRTDLKCLNTADSQEQAQQRENDEVLQELEKHLSDELGLVAFALAREAAGQYGHCSACGEDIAKERLSAVPYTVHCQRCAV
ncbi:TraR/DksA C4-type zinc finger protein [Pseudoalteromonas xiamenensis]|uniref:TraR/DksA family transcriptional regulator n=1 Tax=Pseudoalteromonas xiamenensis TaxID=882626 RepID=UPI0027E4097A|nr:TraR/DksA C4-type zinc finger protein [Pseudoalteromonas xiamenensis]WMN61378.1 TraR/DksA C4-type zinc finger protein [Pseudoalteromonas xiamenensis]